MLREKVMNYLSTLEEPKELHIEEKEYAERQGFLQTARVIVLEPEVRFTKAYIERGNKETEEFLGEETFEFLNQPITYFRDNKSEFMYMESQWFDLIGADAVSLEMDDVFGTYDVMLGLKLQKKQEPKIKKYLDDHLCSDEFGYNLIFDGNEGMWSLNFPLNGLEGYKEDLSIRKAYSLIYSFLFKLAETMEIHHK